MPKCYAMLRSRGRGIALLPTFIADQALPDGRLVSFLAACKAPPLTLPRAAVVHGLLQRHAHLLVIEQGRADITRR
jgi:hypothetical protein